MKVNSDNYLLLLLLIIYLNIAFSTVQTLPIFSSPTSFISSLTVKKGKPPVQQQTATDSANEVDVRFVTESGIAENAVNTEPINPSATAAMSSYTSSISSSSNSLETSITTIDCLGKEEEESHYNVPLERFAQLISTHWQFDHLDSIKSATYKLISEQFQKHITVSFKKNQQQQFHNSSPLQHQFQQPVISNTNRDTSSSNMIFTSSATTLSWDMMDLEILHAQIFGAVQAHTEGSLHLAWDRLADTLGQPALESNIRGITSKYCANINITADDTTILKNNDNMVHSSCLKAKATQISAELDNYVRDNLIQIFTVLDDEVLPKLLEDTSKDLTDVLAYFNRLFFNSKEHQYTLHLEVTPWTTQQPAEGNEEADHILKMRLIPLFDRSVSNDDHLLEFFSNYACLSRA